MKLNYSSFDEDDLLLSKAIFLMGLGFTTLISALSSEPSWQGAFLVFVSFNLVFSFIIKLRDCIVVFTHGISLLIFFYLLQVSIVLETKYIIGAVSSSSQAVSVLGAFPISNYLIYFFSFAGYIVVLPIMYNLKENFRIFVLISFSLISATICSFIFFTEILPYYDVYQLTPVSSGSYIVAYLFFYFIIFFVVFIGYFVIETINELSNEGFFRVDESMNDYSDEEEYASPKLKTKKELPESEDYRLRDNVFSIRQDWESLFGPILKKGEKPSTEIQKKMVDYFYNNIYEDLIERGLLERGFAPKLEILKKPDDGGFGYTGFINALSRRGVKWSDFKRLLNLTPLPDKRGDRGGKGTYDWVKLFGPLLKEGGLPSKDVIRRATQYFRDIIYKDLVKRGLVEKGFAPKLQDLINPKDKGERYTAFLGAIATRGMTLGQLISELGLIPTNRWDELLGPSTRGKTPSKTLKNRIVDYFKDVVYEDLIDRGLIKRGETPSYMLLDGDNLLFVTAALTRGVSYTEILKLSGLEPLQAEWNHSFGPTLDGGGIPNMSLKKKMLEYFINEIYGDLIQRDLVERGNAPSLGQMQNPNDGGRSYGDYIGALLSRGVQWGEIVELSGLKPAPHYPPSKLVFVYDDGRVESLTNKDLSEMLFAFFRYLDDNKGFIYGKEFAASRKHASQLKYMGDKQNFVELETISNYFIKQKKLIKKATINHPIYGTIISHCKKLYSDLNTDNLGMDGHKLIGEHFITSNPQTLAVEIPVWKRIKEERYFTGHIDLLIVNGNEIIISDFKPKGREEILPSIPQLTAYGILLKEQLVKFFKGNFSREFKITCLGFDRNQAYYFDPFEVKEYIIPFLDYERKISKRTKGIKSRASETLFRDDFKLIL